eukprot:1676306-Pleurochrysis_carterae.AAC.1
MHECRKRRHGTPQPADLRAIVVKERQRRERGVLACGKQRLQVDPRHANLELPPTARLLHHHHALDRALAPRAQRLGDRRARVRTLGNADLAMKCERRRPLHAERRLIRRLCLVRRDAHLHKHEHLTTASLERLHERGRLLGAQVDALDVDADRLRRCRLGLHCLGRRRPAERAHEPANLRAPLVMHRHDEAPNLRLASEQLEQAALAYANLLVDARRVALLHKQMHLALLRPRTRE